MNALSPRIRSLIINYDPTQPGALTVSEFCKSIKVSRSVFYKIRDRAKTESAAALHPRSRAPKEPARKYHTAVVNELVRIRRQLRGDGWDYGPRSIYYEATLLDSFPGGRVPSITTIARLLKSVGQVDASPRKRPKSSYVPFARSTAMALWQLDAFEYRLTDMTVVTIYQLLDDATRFDVGTYACARSENSADAKLVLTRAISTHGAPQELLSDNSSAFNQLRQGRIGSVEVYLASQGTMPITGLPGRPTTQGKNERSHQTLIRFLDAHPPATLAHMQQRIEQFREHYNHRRPHQALSQATPASAWDLLEHTPATEPIPMVVLEARAAEYLSRRRIGQHALYHADLTVVKDGKVLRGAADDVLVEQGWNEAIVEVTKENHQVYFQGWCVKLSGEEYVQAKELYDPVREERAHQLARVLTAGSVKILPEDFLKDYSGDLAIDSTALIVQGMPNPNDKNKTVKRDLLNGDFQCGWYTRTGDHDGTKVAHAQPGYELDTTVMVDAKKGAFAFPLVTGIYLHLPAELTKGPQDSIRQHASLFSQRGLVIADRWFNGQSSENFQEPVRRLGFETVFDYKYTQLGGQGNVPGHPVTIVDGVPYVNRMPEKYRMVSRWHAVTVALRAKHGDAAVQKAIDEAKQQNPAVTEIVMKGTSTKGKLPTNLTIVLNPITGQPYTSEDRDEIMAARAVYRMKPHGKIDKDGYQRFSYPDPRTYIPYDPATQKVTDDTPTGTVRLGLAHETIKHLQKFPWKAPEWVQAYGQRNQVETSNKILKDATGANLGNPAERTGRGFAYTYLVAMLGVAASNVRRIMTGIVNVTAPTQTAAHPKVRARRRRDALGQRLPHSSTRRPRSTDPVP